MDRSTAFAALKSTFDEAVLQFNLHPEPSFLSEDAAKASDHCLSLRQRQINDEEFAVLLKALRIDTFFTTLDVTANLITTLGAKSLASMMCEPSTSLQMVILEHNLIKEKGGEDLEKAKTTAFSKYRRNWVIQAKGNPMPEDLIIKLKTPIIDFSQSRRASNAESLASLKDTSPIQPLPGSWKLSGGPSRASMQSEELFEGDLHVSELRQPPQELPKPENAENEEIAEQEIADYRNKEMAKIPVQFAQMTSIRRLALGGNRIVKIEGLPEGLEALELKKNLITVITGLEALSALKYLDLSDNKLTAISGLGSNFAVREISLAGNNIKQITGLEHLRELRRLNLANNNISSFIGIRTISMNSQLKFLVLQGNPIFLQAKYKVSVCNLLPRLMFLDFMPARSWQNRGFNQTQSRMQFFSIDFADLIQDSARTKVTPRFAFKPIPAYSQRNKLDFAIPDTDEDPDVPVRPATTKAKRSAPRLKKANKESSPPPEVLLPPNHHKSTSVHTTYFLPEESQGPHPLTVKEKEDVQRHLRAQALFRGVQPEVIKVLAENAERQHAYKGDTIQDGDVIVSRMILVIRGKLQWKSTLVMPWSSLFVESLVVPMEAEEQVVCLETADYVTFERLVVGKVLEMYPASKDVFYRNYDNLQLSKEQPLILSPSQTIHFDTLKAPLGNSQRRPVFSPSSRVPKINLKTLLKSETSANLGLTTLSLDQRTIRVQSDIDRMLGSDPYRPEEEVPVSAPDVESFEDWKDAVKYLDEHVSSLMSFYQRENSREKEKMTIDEEAKSFVATGPERNFEFLALNRGVLRECAEQAFLIPLSESISAISPEDWIEDYVSSLERDEDEALKQMLDAWLLDIQRDMEMRILAISNALLMGNEDSISSAALPSYKDAADEFDLQEIRSNPSDYLANLCGERMKSPDVNDKVRTLIDITDKDNYCRESLDRLHLALQSKNEGSVQALRAELLQEGVINLAMLPSPFFLRKKKERESVELVARMWARKNEEREPDASVSSGVSSRADLR